MTSDVAAPVNGSLYAVLGPGLDQAIDQYLDLRLQISHVMSSHGDRGAR